MTFDLPLPTPIRVELSLPEVAMAAQVGCRRQLSSLQKGLKDKHGAENMPPWDIHIAGAIAEMAFAKWLNVFWDGSVDTFKSQGDVHGVEVRYSTREDGELIVRDQDHDERPYVLVVGKPPHLSIVGWIRGKEAKEDSYRKAPANRPPAFFVPQECLRDMQSLLQRD